MTASQPRQTGYPLIKRSLDGMPSTVDTATRSFEIVIATDFPTAFGFQTLASRILRTRSAATSKLMRSSLSAEWISAVRAACRYSKTMTNGHQNRKELVSRPRVRTSTIRIESHDQEQELVIGGGSDVSYAVVETAVDYDPPDA